MSSGDEDRFLLGAALAVLIVVGFMLMIVAFGLVLWLGGWP